MSQKIPFWAKLWALRVLAITLMAFLCWLSDSPTPAVAFALSWGPNGLFLVAFMKGVLRLPRKLEIVHAMEPQLYQWIGVGLVKRIVATRIWPMLVGMEPPPKVTGRRELLMRTELSTKGAEVCHGATLLLVLSVSMYCVAIGQISEAVWILVFNVAFNGYPVMLQRLNRWRIQQIRANL